MNLEYWISTTFSLLNWLFFHTIYGMLGVAILVYLLFRDLRKTFPRFPEPALVAGLVFLVGAGTLPSIPRFQFHNEMLKLMPQIEGSGRVASTSSWRSMTEPLTWVNPPIGAVTLVWLQTSHFVGGGQRIGLSLAPYENRFYERTVRYGEKPAESAVDVDCVQSIIRYTRMDESGMLHPVTPVKMVAREKHWYCEHEWSWEKWSWEKAALWGACGKACQVLAIDYIRWDEEPNDPVSTRAADQAFGAKKCTDTGMTPVQIMPTRWTRESKYSTRHWVVLCARPQ